MHTSADLHPLPRLRQLAAWVLAAWMLCLAIAAAAPLAAPASDVCRSPDSLHTELSGDRLHCAACLPAVAPPPGLHALHHTPTPVAAALPVATGGRVARPSIGLSLPRGPPSLF